MPNLVGIGNSQVPTNAMLGGLAYQDPAQTVLDNLEPGNISKIQAELNDHQFSNAFIYDTRKDSDGGAWRHKCRDQSWSNEPLGSNVRGTRKEFPSVAILLLKTNTTGANYEGINDDLIIYDADDPSFPMWMKVRFQISSSGQNIKVRAKNGWIVYGANNNGLLIMDFPKDRMVLRNHVHRHTYQNIYPSRLGRTSNQSSKAQESATGYAIKGEDIKCFDMTVLSDAPVDEATGLPRPTIAGCSGSNNGWWRINDDRPGNTSDIGESGGSNGYGRFGSNCAFVLGGQYFFAGKNTYGSTDRHSNLYLMRNPLDNSFGFPTTHQNAVIDFVDNGSDGNRDNQINWAGNFSSGNKYVDAVAIDHEQFATGVGSNNAGIMRFCIHNYHIRSSLVCYTDYDGLSAYVTGWCPGEFRSGWCMDTLADEDANGSTGSVKNNGFVENTSYWYGDSGASVTWTSSNNVTVTNGGGDNTYAIAQANCLVSGRKYQITGTIVPTFSGSYEFRVRAGGSGTQWNKTSGLTSGSSYNFDTGTITADGANLEIGSNGGNITQFTLTNLRVYEKEDMDRSQYDKRMVVAGVVTKEAVASGAELVGYGNFSSSNFLHYDGVSTPGTGDFYVAFWAKAAPSQGSGGYFHAFSLGNGSTGGQGLTGGFVIKCGFESDGMRWYPYSGSNEDQGITWTATIQEYGYNNWALICCGRRNGVWRMYMNGYSTITGDTNSVNFNEDYLSIGVGFSYNEHAGPIRLALMRYGTGKFPTDKQIQKMYNDEKALFTENAKCSIYGTSNQIEGMDYDDTTGLLHVGTSAGRSDFSGLVRINNTTTPITHCISASGGLIVER